MKLVWPSRKRMRGVVDTTDAVTAGVAARVLTFMQVSMLRQLSLDESLNGLRIRIAAEE